VSPWFNSVFFKSWANHWVDGDDSPGNYYAEAFADERARFFRVRETSP